MIHGLGPDRWAVLSPHLDEALELPLDARSEWLEGLRARDPALATDVERLLGELDQAAREEFLESPLAPLATLAGQTIGAYTLRAPLGRGGMGSVWLADRSDGRYQGVAAVKLLNASLIGQGAESRFRREGSFLARLRHRHIAQLIDAGVSPAGQPYLVLEHVDGEHLDRYCDGRRLGVTARVRLFLDVLSAVAHAHANLVVHRDLKPSNVLVDRDGTVKLLDFGVAKLLAPDADAVPATLTLAGEAALTPRYAAPEQLDGGDVTTATDVFSLGVLLHQLLAGRHPTGVDAGATPGEVLHAVLEREPERLSAAVTNASGDPRARAADRGATLEALRRALAGDLETIVAKALKKNPAERYVSVVAFADDLRRCLEHAPIRARPDTLRYRAAKFVRRHRLPVALGGVLLVALAAGFVGTAWQARAAARARDAASRERDLALAQLERAESINLFAEFLLGRAVPGGEPVRVRDILARAEELAEKRSGHDPALAVDLLVNLGNIHAIRAETDNATRALERAYGLSRALHDPAARASAACAWGLAVSLNGDHATALRFVDEGIALTSTDPRFDSVATFCLLRRASIGAIQGSTRLVSTSAREALRRLDRRPAAFPERRAEALHMLAMGHRLAAEAAEADRTFAQALEQLRLMGREDSLDAATLLANWSSNTGLTNPLEALAQNRRVVAIFEGSAPDAVPLPALHNQALLLSRLARHSEARVVLERARSVARRHDNAVGGAMVGVRLARACRELGDLACARENLRASEREVPAAFPPGHRLRGDLTTERALLAEVEGRIGEAHGLLLDALALYERLEDKGNSQTEALLDLSRFERGHGSAAEAERRAREALSFAESRQGGMPRSSWVGRSLFALGAARRAQGDRAGVRELLVRAVEHMAPTLGEAHPELIEARRLLSEE